LYIGHYGFGKKFAYFTLENKFTGGFNEKTFSVARADTARASHT
jgi:hypothetical protein